MKDLRNKLICDIMTKYKYIYNLGMQYPETYALHNSVWEIYCNYCPERIKHNYC